MTLTTRGSVRWRIAAVAVCSGLLAGAPAHAQDDSERVRELERQLERSLRLIDELTRRVSDLEKAGATPARAAAPAPAPREEARIEALERSLTEIAAGRGASAAPGVPLHGFADVGYERSTQRRSDGRRKGFVIGNLDIYLTPSFGGRVKTLAELVFEVTSDGSLLTDLERVQLGYTVSDALTAWIGRFHTPYGSWNTAYHHGAQIQTAITRPRFIDFEDKGGILPAHSVGVWGTGHVNFGNGRLQYDAYIANGNRVAGGVLDFNAYRDDNSSMMAGANVGYRFGGALDGLTVGLHGLRQDVGVYDEAEEPRSRTRVGFTGGYFSFESDNWEGIGEYYRFRNRDLSGGTGTHASWAAFLQVGRTIRDLWTPYYRWEKTSIAPGDNFFAGMESGRSYSRHVLGVRYLLNPKAALKFEANRTREGLDESPYSEARAQFAIRF